MQYKHSLTTLSNGLRVVHVPGFNSESVFVYLSGKVGRRAEAVDEIGAAHFLEHLFFDGTKKRPSAFEVSRSIDQHGAQTNGLTSQEGVGYYVNILADRAEHAFEFLSDIFLNSLLTDADIEKEKLVIAQEAGARRDEPTALLYRHRLSTLYPGQAIGRNIYDEERNLTNINGAVLRSYRARNYVAQNFILMVSGNITKKKALALARHYFSAIPSGDAVVFDKAEVESQFTFKIVRKDLAQSKLSISFKALPADSPDLIKLQCLENILGGGMSSRLYTKLRHKKHLVYYVGAASAAFSDTGYLSITAFADEAKIQDVVDEIFVETRKIKRWNVRQDELAYAKTQLLAGLLLALDSHSRYAQFIASNLLCTDEVADLAETKKAIESVTVQDIKEMAQTIFSDKPKINLLTKSLDRLILSNKF